MEVLRGLNQLSRKGACAMTIGTFDGVHKGHEKILNRLKEVAKKNNWCTMLVTFYPHPRLIVQGGTHPVKLLTSQDEKLDLLEKAGLDRVLIIPFDESFSQMDYRQFVRNILIDQLDMKALIVGYDHAFGKDRAGNFENLTRLSQELGFYVEKVEPFELNGERVGSRFIRDLIREGKVDRAAVFLGRLYHLSGTVVKGVARGRTLHFPTANLKLDYENKLLPENGVYAVDVRHDGKIYKGMLNIGFKPTFETGHAFTIEVHILNFDKEIYNEQLTVFFKKRLRSEKRFASKEALMAQLKIDKQQSLKL